CSQYYSMFSLFPLSAVHVFSFLSLVPRAPSSTLFPYTTLFRSPRCGPGFVVSPAPTTVPSIMATSHLSGGALRWLVAMMLGTVRSEEHTSELQSRFDLVCRLLLEKKKKKQQGNHTTHDKQTSPH